MHLDDDNEAKCLFIKTKKQHRALEKPTARFVSSAADARPQPGRIAELGVNMYYANKT